ncbi:MAG: hypothetical protein GOU97_02685 [Nanoarchaeota archaeon]|nr:hypothetical protein [Nanoarchaeota archaeon]
MVADVYETKNCKIRVYDSVVLVYRNGREMEVTRKCLEDLYEKHGLKKGSSIKLLVEFAAFEGEEFSVLEAFLDMARPALSGA